MDIGEQVNQLNGKISTGVVTVINGQLNKISLPSIYRQVIAEIKNGIDTSVVELYYETEIKTWI
jgi:hypothetical protein